MNFFVARLDEIQGTWIVRHRVLAGKYLAGWFTIDFVRHCVCSTRCSPLCVYPHGVWGVLV